MLYTFSVWLIMDGTLLPTQDHVLSLESVSLLLFSKSSANSEGIFYSGNFIIFRYMSTTNQDSSAGKYFFRHRCLFQKQASLSGDCRSVSYQMIAARLQYLPFVWEHLPQSLSAGGVFAQSIDFLRHRTILQWANPFGPHTV